MNSQVLQGLLVPFLGTTLGAALVFFLKRDLPEKVQKGLSGFAAGVMVAASIWSLLIPALEGAADLGAWSFLPATIGFWLGILFLLLLDRLVPHVHLDGEQEGLHASLTRSMMVALAVALHNLPEGMAVGVVYAGSMQPEQVGSVSFASAFALAVGIALQNVPEGAIVAMPLRQAGMSRVKAFTLGMLSGAFEPLGAADHRAGGGFRPDDARDAVLRRGRDALRRRRGACAGDGAGHAHQCRHGAVRRRIFADDGDGLHPIKET